MISDIVLLKELPQFIKNSVAGYVGCISGAILKKNYLALIHRAGFHEVIVVDETSFPIELMLNDSEAMWGDLVRLLGISGVLERAGRILHWQSSSEISQLDAPVRIRRALEELGPTFVKLGQVLATRVDMFPPNWIAEFEKLQSRVPAVPYERLHSDLVRAIKGEPGEVFAEFDPAALAAASIAQVYRARLKDGTPVVVKMRRPGIEAVIQADLRILDHVAKILESEVPDSKRYDLFRTKNI